MLKRVCISVAALVLATTTFAQEAAPDPRERGPDLYVIGAGDVLQILTWKEPDFSGAFKVRYDGKLTLPLVGDVLAAGRSPEQLAEHLEAQIGRFVELAQVTVSIAEPSAQFFVIGKVAKQGAFPYIGAIRVVQALALAGGFQEFAKLSRIFVIRETAGHMRYFPFNYDDLVGKRQLGGNMILLPGDTSVVP